MPMAPVRGIELHYEVEGDAGDWVVFAHGGEGTYLHWWQQVAFLRDRYRCVTYDAAGFGASRLTSSPWERGLTAAADDLVGLLDHLEIDRAFLVGHSMGGGAVSGVAQRHPGRVTGLVMGDTPFGFATAALSRWAEEMIDKIGAGFEVMDHLFGPAFAEEQPALHYLYDGMRHFNPERHGPQGIGAYVAMRDTPPVDYSSFAVPTLFLVGTEDELTLPWLMRAVAAAVGGATLVEIAGAGHSAFAERAEEYNAALAAFLAEHAERGEHAEQGEHPAQASQAERPGPAPAGPSH